MAKRKTRKSTRELPEIDVHGKIVSALAPTPVATIIAPVHAFSVRQWHDSPGNQSALLELLNKPIFKMACQTLLITAMPNAKPVTNLVPGVSAEAMALADANRYHHRSGFTQFYRALHNLARAKDQPKTEAPWGDLLPVDE